MVQEFGYYKDKDTSFISPECNLSRDDYLYIVSVAGALAQALSSNRHNIPGGRDEKIADWKKIWTVLEEFSSLDKWKKVYSPSQLSRIQEAKELCQSVEEKYSFRCVPLPHSENRYFR